MPSVRHGEPGEERGATPPAAPRGKGDRGGTGAAGRARQLLTFRLDLEFRQRLRSRLAGEGRSLSEVVIHGLQLYLQQGAAWSGEAARGAGEAAQDVREPAPARPAPAGTANTGTASTGSARTSAPATTAVAHLADLALPDEVAVLLRDLRGGGQSELLSATLAALHAAGWPLRPLAVALGISRQAVLARIRQQVSAEVRSRVPPVAPPAPFPRRRSARPEGRRPHLTVKIDQALRAAAHRQAQREGSSLSQVIERILDHYLRHGLPHGEIRLGDTTPTRPAARRRRQPPGGARG